MSDERSETEIWQEVTRARIALWRMERAGRMPDEITHEEAAGPLDRADWPRVGDEVLYRHPQTGWQPATVLAVAQHDGDLMLDTGQGPELAALDCKHGTGGNCWLLYREQAAQQRFGGK